jgi:hypothetical protein
MGIGVQLYPQAALKKKPLQKGGCMGPSVSLEALEERRTERRTFWLHNQ